MKTKEYIRQFQPVLDRTLKQAIKNDVLAHAYLLNGEPGTPLLKTAKYIAKSILCDTSEGEACETCRSCLRVENGNYLDLKIIDGTQKNIKKEDVVAIIDAFNQTAIEKKGIQIYIINQIENMRPEDEAVHTLLKFLEEPNANVYAILTTNNIERVIPTIVSRCQVVALQLRDRDSVINEAIALGVNKKNAQLLSKLYNDPEELKDVIYQEKTSQIINAFDAFLKIMEEGRKPAIFFIQKEIIPIVKEKESARFFIDLLSEAYREIINHQNDLKQYLSDYLPIINALSMMVIRPEEGLFLILEARSKIEVNINIALILDHLIINLTKDFK